MNSSLQITTVIVLRFSVLHTSSHQEQETPSTKDFQMVHFYIAPLHSKFLMQNTQDYFSINSLY